MSKQTRRSVSMNGEVHKQLRSLCDKHQTSMSSVVQQLVECFLVLMKDKENEGIGDEELVLSAKDTEKKFSWTTTADPATKKPISGGGVHTL